MGGRDPYSASKGMAELVIASYQRSFFDANHPVRVASGRAGNVIGGGDLAADRIVPDIIRARTAGLALAIRNPSATRPWQHVLEPLGGYLLLGARLQGSDGDAFCKSWNFGPGHSANRTVEEVVGKVIALWGSGELKVQQDPNAPHEDHWLQLNTDRASHYLEWEPVWTYPESIGETIRWYRGWNDGADIPKLTSEQITAYAKAWQDLGRP